MVARVQGAELFFYILGTVFFIGFGVSRIIQESLGECGNDFFDTLNKPSFFPPGVVFGVVWPVLYLLQTIAVYMIRNERRKRSLATAGVVLFFILQFVLSVYQGIVAVSLTGALAVVISSAILAIVVTIVFFATDYVAGFLMVPLILWLAFATALQFAVNAIN